MLLGASPQGPASPASARGGSSSFHAAAASAARGVNRRQLVIGLFACTVCILFATSAGRSALIFAGGASQPSVDIWMRDPRLRALLGDPGRWDNVSLDPFIRDAHPGRTSVSDAFSPGPPPEAANTAGRSAGSASSEEDEERRIITKRRTELPLKRFSDPVACVQAGGPRVDLVIGVPLIEVSVASGLDFDAHRPVLGTISDVFTAGAYPGLGLAKASFEARLCSLCSVTVVRVVVDPNATTGDGPIPGSRPMDDSVGERIYLDSFVPGANPVQIDSALCASKHRTVRHVAVTMGAPTLAAWHDAMHMAVDEVAETVASKHRAFQQHSGGADAGSAASAPLIAFLDAATPPEQPLSRWLSALIQSNATAYQDEIAATEVREAAARRTALNITSSAHAGNSSRIPLGFGADLTDPWAGPYTNSSSSKRRPPSQKKKKKAMPFVPAGDGALLGCPNLFNYGDETEPAKTVARDSVRIESFGLSAEFVESKHTVVFHKQFADQPRTHAGAQQDAAVDAIAPNCFLTTPGTWARLREAQRHIEPGPATADTAAERVAHLTLAVAGLHGIATESARGREELSSLLVALEELFRCQQYAGAAKAGPGPLLATRRLCFRLLRAKETLLDVALKAEGVRTNAVELFRREASAMKRFRDTGDDKPIAEVIRRWTVSKSVLTALDAVPENYACAVRRDGELQYCLEKEMLDPAVKIAGRPATMRYIRDLNELPAVAPLSDSGSVLRAMRAELAAIAADRKISEACQWCDPECELVSGATTAAAATTSEAAAADADDETLSTHAPRRAAASEGSRKIGSRNNNNGKGQGTGALPVSVQNRIRECITHRRRVEKRVLAAAHRFSSVVHNTTIRALLAVQNVTMLTPSAQMTLSWARLVTAARVLDIRMVVRAKAHTTLRDPPHYVVPRAVSRGLRVAWQSVIVDREIHIGLNINGMIARTFEALALDRYSTTGARLQLNTPCGCGTEVLLNTWMSMAVRLVVPTRATMSPVCRCWQGAPVAEFEGMWSMYAQHIAPSYLFIGGHGKLFQERRWPQLPRSDELGDLGKSRVVEIQVHQGDPASASNFEKSDVGGVDYVVSRLSPVLFSSIPDLWVAALNDDGRYDEVWVPHRLAVQALVNSGVRKEKIHVVPETVDTDKFYPTNGNNVPIPWHGWSRDRIGGRRPFSIDLDEPKRANLKFFAHFRWQPASGWDEVLRGFFTSFTSEDKVSLYIKSTYWAPSKIDGVSDERDGDSMVRQAIILGGMEGYHDHRMLPHFEILTEQFSDQNLRGVYKEVDVFVALPHADSFGIHLAQAFSMGKTVICTRCSAIGAAAPNDTAVFVESDMRVVPPEVAEMYGLRQGTKWCEPRVHEVVAAMKRVVRMTPAERLALARRGRRWFVETHRPAVVARKVSRRVKAIEKIVRARWLAGTAVATRGPPPTSPPEETAESAAAAAGTDAPAKLQMKGIVIAEGLGGGGSAGSAEAPPSPPTTQTTPAPAMTVVAVTRRSAEVDLAAAGGGQEDAATDGDE